MNTNYESSTDKELLHEHSHIRDGWPLIVRGYLVSTTLKQVNFRIRHQRHQCW